MSRSRGIPVVFGGVLVIATLVGALVFAGGKKADACQPPPPPTYYTLTVNKSGGDSTCEVRIASPTSRSWTSTSDSASYIASSEYEVEQQVNCPSSYRFSHWESNDDDLDGYTENHAPPVLTLTKNTTATAVFVAKFAKPTEHGIVLSGSAGASYGAAVRLIYENAAGWLVKETVVWAASEPTGCSDCAPHGQITLQPNFIEMPRCNLDGTPNANGVHGYIDDSIMNNNGPPWMLLDVFVGLGKTFPCSSTTEQTSHVKPPGECHTTEFQYPHTQRVSLYNTDTNHGDAIGLSSGVGAITTPWVRP